MKPFYNVVYEFTAKAGGYAGCRNIKRYNDHEHYISLHSPMDDTKTVIAEGISDKEAQDFLSLTPEICRLTAATEEFCDPISGKIIFERAGRKLQLLKDQIIFDRQHRTVNRLHPEVGFTFIDIGSQDTQKNQLFNFIKMAFTDPHGTIGNLDYACMILMTKITAMANP